MKKRYLIIALLFMVCGLVKAEALTIGDCKVLVTFKQNSSLDENVYICKGKVYGVGTDNIYYSGKGNVIKINNFKAYYFANTDLDVTLDISGNNTFSLLHVDSGKLSVIGNGSLKFKENSFVKKSEKGNLVYHYKYKNNVVLDTNKKAYEGTIDNFVSSYEELKKVNKLPSTYEEENFVKEQVLDYQKMVPIVVTDSWIQNNIDTKLFTSVEDGFGIIKKVIEENKLESEKGILISSEKVDKKYELNVDDLTEEEIGSIVERKLEDKNLVSFYNISVYNGLKEVSMKDGKYTIKLKVDDNIFDYENLKIIYVNERTEIEEYIDARLEDGYIVFETSHLSNYGIVGNLKVQEEVLLKNNKPTTSEYIISISFFVIIALFCISLIIFVVIKSGIYKNKKRKR